eukprot:TRINITY_DN6827_c0_g1_i1.p1 TRINITY_DN6827_c0_g1~~TRINITY_DN6827_c0_g1_i1.p1  ORF type:complete len:690 (+),score=148.34 TRINITY_DN6827_c0_g1_i1:68-2137(+)
MSTTKLQQKSPAEFFAENKNIAGFDNPGKSLYTTIREFVENSLDAAESINILPEVFLTIEEVTKSKFDSIYSIPELERKNLELYNDFETEKQKQARISKTAKVVERERKKLAKKSGVKDEPGEATQDPTAIEAALNVAAAKEKAKRGKSKEVVYYNVTCKDNGAGMLHDDIPNMLGRVLSSTKYGVKQSRGKFGLGAKMALIWSKQSTGQPITIRSAKPGQDHISECVLDIDIYRNMPNIRRHVKLPNPDGWHGSELSVLIAGNWSSYGHYVIKYMRQLAVITPYAQFHMRFKSESDGKSFYVCYRRRSDVMPPPPREIRYHPSSINLLMIEQLMTNFSNCNLKNFLTNSFEITPAIAMKIAEELKIDPATSIARVDKATFPQQLVNLFRDMKFPDPPADALSPAGEYNLRLGIIKEIRPDLVATYHMPVEIYEGHPFIVEAGVSIGGDRNATGINVYRFANRIPLLFEPGGDVASRTAFRDVPWTSYKINKNTDKIGVFVSIVSTKIPFKGTGKEYIGDDILEMREAVKKALLQCCLQLRHKIKKRLEQKERRERKKVLLRYVPDVSRSLFSVLETIAANPAKRRRLNPEDQELIQSLDSGKLTVETLMEKLETHVNQSDMDNVLDFMTHGEAKHAAQEPSDFFITPLDAEKLGETHPLSISHPCLAAQFMDSAKTLVDPAELIPSNI